MDDPADRLIKGLVFSFPDTRLVPAAEIANAAVAAALLWHNFSRDWHSVTCNGSKAYHILLCLTSWHSLHCCVHFTLGMELANVVAMSRSQGAVCGTTGGGMGWGQLFCIMLWRASACSSMENQSTSCISCSFDAKASWCARSMSCCIVLLGINEKGPQWLSGSYSPPLNLITWWSLQVHIESRSFLSKSSNLYVVLVSCICFVGVGREPQCLKKSAAMEGLQKSQQPVVGACMLQCGQQWCGSAVWCSWWETQTVYTCFYTQIQSSPKNLCSTLQWHPCQGSVVGKWSAFIQASRLSVIAKCSCATAMAFHFRFRPESPEDGAGM